MQEIEIWKPVVGYEGWYEVSSFGRVRSVSHKILCNNRFEKFHNGRVLSQQWNNRVGYYTVCLSKDSKIKRLRVHRLVAIAFLQNPNNLPQVNHKDEDKRNNRVDNLEWCDGLYNSNYGSCDRRRRESAMRNKKGNCYPKVIKQYSLDGKFVASYNSSQEAARAIGRPNSGSSIRACARGEKKHNKSCGFVWKYEE